MLCTVAERPDATRGFEMSVEAFTWALTVPVGGNAKVVLLGLANHAHPDGSESYPALDTLATYAHCDRSTARRNVRKLAEDGWIVEDGCGPKGQTKWRLNMGGGEMPPVAPTPPRGGKSGSGGVAPAPPEPSKEPSKEPSTENCAREDQFPDDLPESMHDTAIAAGKVLKATALRRGQRKAVTRASVGQAVLSFPDRDHVAVARRVEAWLLYEKGATKSCRDIVARYRNFLESAEPMAGPPLPQGVAPMFAAGGGRRMSNAETVAAQSTALRAAAASIRDASNDTFGNSDAPRRISLPRG